jgi:hypothetical protein
LPAWVARATARHAAQGALPRTFPVRQFIATAHPPNLQRSSGLLRITAVHFQEKALKTPKNVHSTRVFHN